MMTNTTISTPTVNPKILLMAGGTGGHVFPALAIAEELRRRGITVYWLGTSRGLEARVVPNKGFDLRYISINGLRGKRRLNLVTAPFKIAIALWQSLRLLWTLQPTAVIGMGGFVTGPGGVATWLTRTPLLIHEQNAIAGLTNRWLARIADVVMTAYPRTFPTHYQAVHTGNPLRADIMAIPEKLELHQPLHILVIGGSLGAQVLNETIPQALLDLTTFRKLSNLGSNLEIEIWHQTGEAHLTTMQNAYTNAPYSAKIVAFIENMAEAYQWADLVICRAGALTISELAQAGVASILIPYPHAVDDHQTRNGEYLVQQGAAMLLPQTELTADKLAKIISGLIQAPEKIIKMSQAARQCATPQALSKIIEILELNLRFDNSSRVVKSRPFWGPR